MKAWPAAMPVAVVINYITNGHNHDAIARGIFVGYRHEGHQRFGGFSTCRPAKMLGSSFSFQAILL